MAVVREIYFTGKPCSRGHVAWRNIKHRECMMCRRENAIVQSKRQYRKDPEKSRADRQTYYQRHPEKFKESNKRARARGYNWYQDVNNGRGRYLSAKRKLAKMQRTPKWADLDAIAAFYANCPADMTVDHIIPLQGKTVSGLHTLNNLQYLTKAQNSAKHNKYNPDIYPEQRSCLMS